MLRLDCQRVIRARRVNTFVLDLDGTLVEHRIDYSKGRRMVIERIRRELPKLAERLADKLTPRTRAYEIISLAKGFGEEVADRVRLIIYEEYEKVDLEAVGKTRLREGVEEALKRLRELRVKIAIVTNNARNPTERLLSRFPILNEVDVIITRDESKELKPDPSGVLMAISLTGSRPFNTLMAGDSIVDVITARKAGVVPVGVKGGVSKALELYRAGAYTIVGSVLELVRRVEGAGLL